MRLGIIINKLLVVKNLGSVNIWHVVNVEEAIRDPLIDSNVRCAARVICWFSGPNDRAGCDEEAEPG